MSGSAAASENDTTLLCTSCGIAGVDDIKLKDCDDCDLVRYCCVKCQRDHRPKHEEECKKRAAELRDEILFKQPEGTHYGDCPICCLPLSFDREKSVLMVCCSKIICNGCYSANKDREYEGRLEQKCPFCRNALPKTGEEEEANELLMKRIEVNDPVALYQMGTVRYYKGDCKAAFEYWTRAASMGDVEAHFQLSTLYDKGKGVEKDEKRALYHVEKAAIGGHLYARHNLGCVEEENGRVDRAVKHWIIAAKLGYDDSLENLKILYSAGLVSKEDFEASLRGHYAAIDATKSPQREEAAEFHKEKEH